MSERSSRRDRPPAIIAADRGAGRLRTSPPSVPRRRFRRPKVSKPVRVLLPRSASEPTLWTVRFLPGQGIDGESMPRPGADGRMGRSAILLPGLQAGSDVLSPSPPPRRDSFLFDESAKVVVSVTVEGSPGPVRAMVRVGASVEEAISAVVDKYRREGRSPVLDKGAAASFQLHHSHFSLQSLSKSDRIGEVGGRSFYLRTSNSFRIGSECSDFTSESSEIKLANGLSSDFFFAFFVRRFKKIGRRTRKLWKLVACIVCI